MQGPDAAAPAPQPWIVKGLIVARRMPPEPITILGVEIRLLPEPRWTADHTLHLSNEHEEGARGTAIAAGQPAVGFQAYHELEVTVETTSAPEAAAAGFQRFARVAAAFAIAGELDEPGPVVSVEDVRRQDGGQAGNWQRSVRFAELRIDDADSDFKLRLDAVAHVADSDEGFTKLLDSWARAERFYFLAANEEDRRRALLAYAQTMESIGQLVHPELPPNPEAEAAAAEVVAEVTRRLGLQPSTKEAKKAIRLARQELDRIDVTTGGQRMRKAGEEIGLPERARQGGEELWRLRNQKASHDGVEVVANEEMVFAREVADDYFRAYAQWRLKKLEEAAKAAAASEGAGHKSP